MSGRDSVWRAVPRPERRQTIHLLRAAQLTPEFPGSYGHGWRNLWHRLKTLIEDAPT